MTMPASSAGILMYRRTGKALEVLLVHPGGPFWRNEDDGAWSNPKGEMDEGEDPGGVTGIHGRNRQRSRRATSFAWGDPSTWRETCSRLRDRGGHRCGSYRK